MIQGFLSTKRALLTSLLALTFLGVGALVTSAAPTPNSIPYQGFLTSATGTAQTGTTTVTVRLYDASTGGTLLFEELHPTTPIVNGYFSVQIGSVGDVNGSTAATGITDLLFDKSYYLTVELGSPFSTGEMTTTGGTRSQLGTVPFANIAYGALQATSSTGLTQQKGKMYFNTGDNQLYIYNGTAWSPLSVLSTTFSTLTVTGTTSLQAASTTALSVSGPTFLNALTLTNASSTGGITATTFYGALLGTATLTSLTVTGNTTLTNASSTNLTSSGQAYLNNASATNVSVSNNLVTNNLQSVSATSTNLFSNLLSAVTSTITNLFFTSATGTNLVISNNLTSNNLTSVSATATNLAVTNLSTSNSLTVSTNTITSNIGGSVGTSTIITSNVASSSANFFQTLVNGISSTIATIINSFTQSTTGNVLSTTINGLTATTSVITSNALSTSGTTLTTTINGIATTTDLTNLVASSTSNTLTVSTSTNSFTLTSTVNGQVATTTARFLNSNDLSSAVNTLTSTINGLSTSTSIINSSTLSANAGVVTTVINGVTATTSVSNLFAFIASSTNSNLAVATTSAGLVTYTLTDTPTFSSTTITGQANFNNASATAITSTTGFFSTFLATLANITDLVVGNSTTTNAVITNATIANATATGNVTTNTLTATGQATLSTASATALTATTLYSVNSVLTNATATLFAAVNASTTFATTSHSYITTLIAASSTLTDALLTRSTTTDAYITRLVAASSTLTEAIVTTLNAATLNVSGQTTLSNASATNLTVSNNLVTNNLQSVAGTSTNFFSTLLNAVTAVFTNLTTTNATTTNLVALGATTLATTSVSSLTITGNTTITNASTTNLTNTGDLSVQGQSTLTTASATALSVSGPTFLNALTLTNASSTGGITATTFYGALLGTANLTSLNVTGQTTLANASATALTVSGQTTLGFASSTALSATTLYGALIGTTGSFSSTLNVAGDTTLSNASTSNLTTSLLFNVLGTSTLATTTASSLTTNSLITNTLSFTNASSTGGLTLASLFGANLTSCNTSTEKLLWANGTFTCGTDAGGAGGTITSLNGSSVASQSLATSTLSTVGLDLLITSSTTNGIHTFSLSPQAGYAIPLTASSSNWNSFFNSPVSYLTQGANLLFSGTSTIALNPNLSITSLTTGSTTITGTSTLATTTISELVVTGQTTLTNASTTALTVSGQTFLQSLLSLTNASSTGGITATSFYGALLGTANLSTLDVTGQSSLANASTSNLSTTNLYATGTLSVSGQSTLSTASATGITSTNIYGTDATITNATSTNFFATLLNAVTAVITNLTATTGTITNLTSTDATSTKLVTIGTTTLATTGGSVGIGTATPSNPLTVSASTTNTAAVYFNNTNTLDGNGLFIRGGGANTGKYALAVQNATGTDIMRVLANGNIGIGTTSPSTTLDISGNVRVWNQNTTTASTTNFAIRAGSGQALTNIPWVFEVLANDGSTRLSGTRIDGLTSAQILSTQDITTGALSQSATYMKGLSLNNSAGVGWSATGNWYDVKDTSISRISTSTVGIGTGAIGNTSGTLLTGQIGVGTTTLTSLLSVASSTASGTSRLLSVGTTSEVFTVLANGNIGIGTTAPTALLSVGLSNQFTVASDGQASANGVLSPTFRINSRILLNASDTTRLIVSNVAQSTGVSFGVDTDGTLKLRNRGDTADAILTAGTSTFSGNVGIGTTTPSQKLSVEGAISIDSDAFVLGAVAGVNRLQYNASAFRFLSSGDSPRFTVEAAGNSYFPNGNVGIGTTTPSNKLDITGDVNSTGVYKINGVTVVQGSTTLNSFYFGNAGNTTATGSANTAVGNSAGSQLSSGVNNSLFGYLAGYLTSTGHSNSFFGQQAGRLNVSGGVNTFTGFSAGYSNVSGDNNTAIGGNAGYGNVTGSNNIFVGNNSGRYLVDGVSLASTTNLSMYLGVDTRASSNTASNEIVIGYGTHGAGSNSVVLGSSTVTTTILRGNVGIGTTTPNSVLSLQSASTPELSILETGKSRYSFAASDNFATRINGTDRLTLQSSGNFIVNTGNLGIGTTTPGAKLTVVGTGIFSTGNLGGETQLAVRGTQGAYNAGLLFDSTNTTYAGRIGFLINTGDTTFSSSASGTGSFSENMRITNSGNVGIGTTTPLAKLAIQGTSGSTTPLFMIASSSATVSPYMSVLASGNVGIGASIPASLLHITRLNNGSAGAVITLENGADALNDETRVDSILTASSIVSGRIGFIRTNRAVAADSDIYLSTFSNNTLTERMRIRDNGNVGIGTTSPAQKLDVWGNVVVGTSSTPTLFVDTANRTVSVGSTSPSWFNGTGRLWVEGSTYLNGGAIIGSGVRLNWGDSMQSIVGTNSSGLRFLTNDTDRVVITSTGNVGIGSSTPSRTLAVSGDMTLTGGFYDSTNASGTLGQLLWSTGTSTLWVSTSSLGISSSLTGGTNGYVTRWTSPSTLSTGVLFDNGTVAGINATSSSYTFNIQGGAGVNPFNVASSTGESLFVVLQTGKVGIGTTTPTSKLTIAGDGTAGNQLRSEYANTNTTLTGAGTGLTLVNTDQTVNNFAGIDFRSQNTSGSEIIASKVVGVFGTRSVSQVEGMLAFMTRSSSGTLAERMRIDGTGRVGIGSSTPIASLALTGTEGTNPLVIASSTGAALLTLLQNGNLGISSSSPVASLSITGTAGANPLMIASSSGAALLTLSQSGYLGINTNAPRAVLDVVGTSSASSLGSEIITATEDRDFSVANNWTYNTGWARNTSGYASTTATTTATLTLANGFLSQAPANGGVYLLSFDVTTTSSGTLTVAFGSTSHTANFGQYVGTLTYSPVIAASGNGAITFTPSATWLGRIDNVSIVTLNPLTPTQVIRDSAGSSPLEFRSSDSNAFVGYQAGMSNYGSAANSFFGYQAGMSNLGYGAGANSFFGYRAGASSAYGYDNTFVGAYSGQNVMGSRNTALGAQSLIKTTIGGDNVAVGASSLNSNTSGGNNTAIGAYSLYLNQNGNDNVAVGVQALYYNTSGSNNAVFGANVGRNAKGNFNSFFGNLAGYGSTQSNISNAVAFGYQAGYQLATSTGNILLGYRSGDAITTGSYNTILGYDIDAASSTGSYQLNIGNILFGQNIDGTGLTVSTGNLGVGTATPFAKFSIQASHGNTQPLFDIATTTSSSFATSSIFTVLPNGRVGIGTTTGTSLLTVGGTLTATGTITSNTYLQSGGTGSSIDGRLYAYTSAGAVGAIIQANGFSYFNGGDVGIGTTTPGAKLDVSTNALFGSSISGIETMAASGFDFGAGDVFVADQLGVEGGIFTDAGYYVGGNQIINSSGYLVNLGGTVRSIAGSGLFFQTNGSSTSHMVITTLGDIGLGTSTPGSRLDVASSTSTSDVDIFRIITDVGSTGNVKFRIDSDGDVFTDGGTTIGTPADLAENYPTNDPTIVPGMVVALSTTTITWSQSLPNGSTTDYEIATVKKAEKGEEVLGVISTRPGILLGGNTTNGIPVAFSGRVPVYVVGDIQVGDSLTISTSTPGYAMKQTTNSQSIGRAISSSTPNATSSLVMMVVENTNRTITLSGQSGLAFLSSATSTLPTTTVREELTTLLTNGYSLVKEYVAVKVSAVTGYFDTLFARDIYTERICVKKSDGINICLTGDQVENVLNASNIPLLQNNVLSGTSTDDFSSSTSDFSTTTLETTTLPENQSGDQSSSSTQDVPNDTTTNQGEPVVATEEDATEVTQSETPPVDTETQ